MHVGHISNEKMRWCILTIKICAFNTIEVLINTIIYGIESQKHFLYKNACDSKSKIFVCSFALICIFTENRLESSLAMNRMK